jgi:hypothetical protein
MVPSGGERSRQQANGQPICYSNAPRRQATGGYSVNEWLLGDAGCIRARSAAVLLFAMAAALCLACNSAADMRYWCLKQANHAVNGSATESEANERRVHEMYLRCLESHEVPDAEPRPPV